MSFLANLFGYVLNFLYNFVNNYGIAIILFSILLKIILLPISIKQQKTMRKSTKIQQEVNKIQVKYKNNPEKMNQEIMQLYKQEKMSPFSGCLSSIVQLVLLVAVFYLVSKPLTFMKKIDTPKIEQYSQEISQEGKSSSYPEIRIIELKSEQDPDVYINMEFLGLNLSHIPTQNYKDPKVYVIPVLYIISTFISIRLSTSMNKSKKEDVIEVKEKDEEEANEKEIDSQQEAMKQMTSSMNYMMPIMSIGIAIIAPLGLSLYWFISNLLQIIERLVINKISSKKEEKENG